jgi:hypothetical protein
LWKVARYEPRGDHRTYVSDHLYKINTSHFETFALHYIKMHEHITMFSTRTSGREMYQSYALLLPENGVGGEKQA